jgi:nucleoside-diphosphate-sugar epimerase
LIKRLISDGYDVTLLDNQAPTSSDLQYLSDHSVPSFDISSFASSNPSSSRSRPGKLILADVDIRRYKPLRNVFKRSEQFDGIVHLAGVARNTWCTERETECADLNVNGTKRVFDAAMESSKGKAPWFIYLSSIDVYGYRGELGSGTMNVLGKTKWATQQALRTAHDTAIEQGKSPRTAVLRLATTFGSPKEFKDRLLPAVVGRAMGEMPLQIMDADERIDLMRIEDALEGIMGAVNMLQGGGRSESVADLDSVMEQGQMTEREESPLANAGNGYWDEFDLVSGSTISPNELVNIVMAATSSSSPIQDFSLTREKAGPYRRVTPPVDSRAETILGFTARIPVEIGLAAYIHEQQAAFIDWATGYMRRNCPESAKYGNKAAVHRADIRNKEMDRLMGCTINMGVNHKGWVHHMKCGEKDGISCQADNIKRDSYNWNQTVFTVVPPYKGSISPLAADLAENNLKPHRRATKGPLVVQFEEELTKMVLGFRRKKGGAAASTAPIKFKLFTKEEALASEIVTEFEPRVSNQVVLSSICCRANSIASIDRFRPTRHTYSWWWQGPMSIYRSRLKLPPLNLN